MRIRSNILEISDLHREAQKVLPGSWFERNNSGRSRTHKRYFDFLWWCDHSEGRRRPNSGGRGAHREGWAPSYDEWGTFLAALYEIDPDALMTYYKNADDFHRKTGFKFAAGRVDHGVTA